MHVGSKGYRFSSDTSGAISMLLSIISKSMHAAEYLVILQQGDHWGKIDGNVNHPLDQEERRLTSFSLDPLHHGAWE